MFRIGEFSRIAQTAVSQLRYYDRIGLFQPEHTDKFTGYRYYRASQLPDLHRILAMKELGLTLEQIQRLVVDNVSAEELRGMLSLKKAQVEQELHAQIKRLHHIEARLRQVEQEGGMAMDDVIIKEIAEQPFLGFRDTLPDVRDAVKLRMEITRLLPSRISKRKFGHFVALLHEDGMAFENADIEMGFLLNEVIDQSVQLSSGHNLTVSMLPPVEMAACAVRVGGFESGYDTYGNLGRWVEANGYQMIGPVREVFIKQTPLDRIDEMVTEIQVPVSQMQTNTLSLSV